MRQDGNIQVQDPSVSPTFGLSRPTQNPDAPPSLRRNLFGPHLSRRPVATTSVERMPDPFVSTTSSSSQHAPRKNSYSAMQQHRSRLLHASSHEASVYEPRLSPTRSQSSTKASSYNSAAHSIVALDPATGRPQLPVMPQLPPKMREDSDEEEEQADEVEEDHNALDDPSMVWRRAQGHHSHDLDLHSSSLVGLPSQQARLHDLIDTAAPGSEYRDYEKIESILSEMQSQQRARARTAATLPTPDGSLDTPSDPAVSARTRGKARATTRSQARSSTSDHSTRASQDQDHNVSRTGGVGATLKPEDKDELLGLIMTSLRKRLQQADEDAWMFGDERTAANGVSITGSFNIGQGDELEY